MCIDLKLSEDACVGDLVTVESRNLNMIPFVMTMLSVV